MAKEVECELSLWEKFVPEEVQERAADAGKDAQEMSFEGADCALSNVAVVHVWGNKLIGSVSGLGDHL